MNKKCSGRQFLMQAKIKVFCVYKKILNCQKLVLCRHRVRKNNEKNTGRMKLSSAR